MQRLVEHLDSLEMESYSPSSVPFEDLSCVDIVLEKTMWSERLLIDDEDIEEEKRAANLPSLIESAAVFYSVHEFST